MLHEKSLRIGQRPSRSLLFLLFAAFANSLYVHAFTLSMVDRGTVVVAGATGYIGKSTVRESVRQGYKTVALVRNSKKVQSDEGQRLYGEFFQDAQIVECDVSNKEQLEKVGTRREHLTYSKRTLSWSHACTCMISFIGYATNTITNWGNRIGGFLFGLPFWNQKRSISG